MKKEEIWKDIPGYESLYQVSDAGRVRSLDRKITDKRGIQQSFAGKIMKGTKSRIYLTVVLRNNGFRQTYTIHELVMSAFVGKRPEKNDVCHSDGNSMNNQLQNLRYDTRRNNILDSVKHGTHPQAARMDCPYGHPLSGDNLRTAQVRQGFRGCVSCARADSYISYNISISYDKKKLSDLYFKYGSMNNIKKHNALESARKDSF